MIEEFNQGFAPIVTALPGFQRYTAATTESTTTKDGSPATVFLMNAFDTVEHAAAAQEAAQVFVATSTLKGVIEPLHFTQDQAIFGFPAESSANITTDELVVAGSKWNDEIKGMDGYITYVGTLSQPDHRYTFVYNMYDTEAVSILADTMAENDSKSTSDIPSNTLIVSTQGEIKFDYLCAAGFTFSNSTDDEDDTASASAASSLVVGIVYDFVAKVVVTNSIIIVSSAIVDVLFT